MTSWHSTVAGWEVRERENKKNNSGSSKQAYSKSPPKEKTKASYTISDNFGLNIGKGSKHD